MKSVRAVTISSIFFVVLLNFAALPANAITVGSRIYNDLSFVDSLGAISGDAVLHSWEGVTDTTDTIPLADGIVGPDMSTFIFCGSGPEATGTCLATINFTDNIIQNNAGADFTIFEIGTTTPESFDVIINGNTVSAGSVAVTDTISLLITYTIRGYDFDLDSFGLSNGDSISSMTIQLTDFGNANSADIAAVGALNFTAVPVPASIWLFSSVLGLLGWIQRKAK